MRTIGRILLLCCLMLALAMYGTAQEKHKSESPTIVPIVALDECDPATFNAALGADFCHNVTLGAFTTLSDLFAKAGAGTPDPNWDFEPDELTVREGDILSITNQGGEPHTFTEVAKFGGGFIPPLNNGETTVSECTNGFANLNVARTRILQGSEMKVTGLKKGKHEFQCCIHPWMRVTVDVK